MYLKINRDALERDTKWKPAHVVEPPKHEKDPAPLIMDSMQAQNLSRVLKSLDERLLANDRSLAEENQLETNLDETNNSFMKTILHMKNSDFKKAFMDNVHANMVRKENLETVTEELQPGGLKGLNILDQNLLEEIIMKRQCTK